MTEPPSAVPPPWRPRAHPPFDAGDDPTLVDLPLPDRTAIHPPLMPGPPQPYAPAPYAPGPPPRPRRGWLGGVVACVGLLAGAVVVLLLLEPRLPTANPPSTTVPVTTTTAPPPTTVGGPGRSLDQAAPVGTEVSPAKGWSIRVSDVDLDANAELARAAWWMRPARNKQYVLVTLDVTHQGEHTAALFAEVKMNVVTSSGASVGPHLLNPTRSPLELGLQLPPQGRKTGTVVFELPKPEVRGAVLRLEPMFSLSSEQDQRFLSLTA